MILILFGICTIEYRMGTRHIGHLIQEEISKVTNYLLNKIKKVIGPS